MRNSLVFAHGARRQGKVRNARSVVACSSCAEPGSPPNFPAPAKSSKKWEIEKFSISYRSYRLAASPLAPRQAARAHAFALSSLSLSPSWRELAALSRALGGPCRRRP